MTAFGTLETCQRTLTMSVHRGRPEMRDAFDLNVWSGRAVQEVLVERWLMRSCVNVFGLGLEHVLRTIIDIGRRHFEHSPCLISFLERYFIRRPTVGAVKTLVGLRPMSR